MMVGIFACQVQTSIDLELRPHTGCGTSVRATRRGGTPRPKCQCLAGGLFDFDYLAAFIVTTLEAGAMRQFAFMTVGTFGQRLRRQMIVGAALGRARLRVAPFWIRHENLLTGLPPRVSVTLDLALQLLLNIA